MYSRSQNLRGEDGALRLPEHYSGVAFDRRPPTPRPMEYCAEGLPSASPAPIPSPPPRPVQEEEKAPALPIAEEPAPPSGEGLLGSIGREELLLLGIIYILAQRQGEDDTILLLLLLLLRH